MNLFSEKPKTMQQPAGIGQITPVSPLKSTALPSEQIFAKKPAPEIIALESSVKDQVATVSSRLRLLETSLDSIRGHINLIDQSLIEKHKSVVSEVRSIELELRQMRADIELSKEMVDRISKRLEAFASRQELKVLERYIDMIQPMNFVTRSEIDSIIKKVLKEQGIHIDEEVKANG